MVLGMPAPLFQTHGLSVASGIVYPGLDVDRLSQHSSAVAAASALLASRRQSRGTFTEAEMKGLIQAFAPVTPTALGVLAKSLHTLSTAALPLSAGNDAFIYAASPRLAIVSVGLTVATDGTSVVPSLSIDLRRNALRAATQGSAATAAAWANVRRGLYDGVLEHALIGDLGQGGQGREPTSTITVVDEARRRGVDVIGVTTSDGVSKVQAADIVKSRMRAGLGDGVVLVAPSRSVPLNGAGRLGWWRIDLNSGEALAIMDNGLHSSTTESELVKRKKAEATLWALYEKWVVSFFGGNPVHAETARGFAAAFYQMGRQAGLAMAGPSPWPAVISFSGLAAMIAFILGWWARGTQVPPPPPPPPPRSQ
jgi:hypothetical protein